MNTSPADTFWEIFWTIEAISSLFCAFLAGGIARLKGYSNAWGAVTGLLLGILGVIYYAGLPDLKSRQLLTEILATLREASGHAPQVPPPNPG